MGDKIITVNFEIYGGRTKSTIYYESNSQTFAVQLPLGFWDESIIINELIRSKYPQDKVEAIINNHFLNISDWLNKKFKGEEVEFEDPEYDKLQAWRKQCKEWAKQLIDEYKQ